MARIVNVLRNKYMGCYPGAVGQDYILHQQPLPDERFFGRALRTYLPNFMGRFINRKELIEKSHQKQMDIVKKKARSCTNQYNIGERVITQDHIGKCWNINGTVTAKKEAEDGSFRSFTVQSNAGRELLRNAHFLNPSGKILLNSANLN